MKGLKYLTIITQREYDEAYSEFFKRHGISTVFSTLCNGTAAQKTLDFLGIEKTEKLMLHTFISSDMERQIFSGLLYEMQIDVPGNGIAMTIPMDSIGAESFKYLAEGQTISQNEVDTMNESKYVLIIAIAEKETTDHVMDAARSVNAGGGTVIHAKGTGNKYTSKFFGVSIAAEKEMIYIVAKNSDKDNIMRAIIEKAGMNSEAHAAVFTLPVDSVLGLRSVADTQI